MGIYRGHEPKSHLNLWKIWIKIENHLPLIFEIITNHVSTSALRLSIHPISWGLIDQYLHCLLLSRCLSLSALQQRRGGKSKRAVFLFSLSHLHKYTLDLSAECVLTAVLGWVMSVVLQEMPESEEEVEVEQGPARAGAGLRSKAISLGAGLHRLHLQHRPGYDDPDGETQAQEQISFLHSKCK